MESSREDKKNYAERFSRALAILLAARLRSQFKGITPDELGRGQESRARTGRGYKKLDVNYSTPELGLGLGLSVKTLNFPDPASGRYTKNFTRIDNELRAEASDYHERQPYAVLIGVVFLPTESCLDDTSRAPSSFSRAVGHFRHRNARRTPTERAELLERIFIGLYEIESGDASFFDVRDDPPTQGFPPSEHQLSLDDLVAEVIRTFDDRNAG